MSNAMFANKWLEDGNGPGSPMRPGCGRYGARNALIKHHNVRGEAVFYASRRWQYARAQSDAARTRLDRAVREAEDAEHAELMALMSLGIGRRSMAAFMQSKPAATARPAARPGGHRAKLEERMAKEAAEANAPPPPSKTPQRSRNAGAAPAKEATASPSSDARKAWLAKMQGPAGAPEPAPASALMQPTGGLEVKKPRNRAKTTRD